MTRVRVRIVAVGRLKEAHYREAVADYLDRLRHYAKADVIEVDDGPEAKVETALRKATLPRSRVVALTIAGRARSSEELAAWFEERARAAEDVTFLIGGADGLPTELVRKDCQEQLSLSRMTLPHRLARLVLVEQTYRAMTIRKGEPYHH